MKTIYRRRFEGKTDYKARIALLKSGKKRVVVRKSNRYIIAQIVESDIAQDKVLFSFSSRDLIKKGIAKENSGSLKSLSAAYLTGFFLGEEGLSKGLKEAIFDMGLNRNIHKSRIYAVLKGVIDSGVKVPHNEKALPDVESIKSNKKFSVLINKILK